MPDRLQSLRPILAARAADLLSVFGDANRVRLLWLLMALSVLVSVPLLMAGGSSVLRLGALISWQLMAGAAIAVVTSGLPRVVSDPRQGAAAAGLLSQIAALVTFVTPLIWSPILASGWWPGFLLVLLAAAAVASLLFPATRSAPK